MISEMTQALISGLRRKTMTTCSRWAEQNVCLGKPFPGPLRFKYHPWSKEMHDCDEDWLGKKAAQLAFTATALNRAIFTIDIKKVSVLYTLPKKTPDAADFSKSKFDALLETSPNLANLFSNVKNIGHKQAGNTNLYIRGARSRSGLKAISVGLIVFDEYDEMPVRNISLAEERASGFQSTDRQKIKISTPTIPGYGIDAEFTKSTDSRWIFKCPCCSRHTELIFPDCIKVTGEDLDDPRLKETYILCKECKNKLPHELKHEWLGLHNASWIPQNSQSTIKGFHINQLYSMTVEPWEIGSSILRARFDPAEEQELHNSKMGLAFIREDATINDHMIQECIRSYSEKMPVPHNQLVTMGIDVGKYIHYEIDQWFLKPNIGPDLNMNATVKVLKAGFVRNFEELDRLMRECQVKMAVIDANPEHRKAYEFAMRFFGHVYLCYFSRDARGRNIIINEEASVVKVDRTSWLDLSFARFKNKTILLPNDLYGDFARHIKVPARVEKKDPDGNPVARYVSTAADHHAFSRVYAEIALPLIVSKSENIDIKDLI